MNDVLRDAVEQPAHELGSTPRGCAPDPPVLTGEDVDAHAGTGEGFEKPRSPARSTEIDPKSEDGNKFSPKLLWSDLVQNEEELRNSVPQWYGIPKTRRKSGRPPLRTYD